MPAAAVIPAPIAYIKVAAVKKLVVGSRDGLAVRREACYCCPVPFSRRSPVPLTGCPRGRNVYFEKIRVFKAGRSTPEYRSME